MFLTIQQLLLLEGPDAMFPIQNYTKPFVSMVFHLWSFE